MIVTVCAESINRSALVFQKWVRKCAARQLDKVVNARRVVGVQSRDHAATSPLDESHCPGTTLFARGASQGVIYVPHSCLLAYKVAVTGGTFRRGLEAHNV